MQLVTKKLMFAVMDYNVKSRLRNAVDYQDKQRLLRRNVVVCNGYQIQMVVAEHALLYANQ
jgi:hypothetical protein